MRRILIMLVLLGSLALAGQALADGTAPTGKVVKVLPLLLNLQGHDATSPSLFERDTYQMYLRLHTNEISGVRYDVLWKASKTMGTNVPVKIKVELRAVAPNGDPRFKTLETMVTPGYFRHWTSLELAGDDYKNLGNVVAWRTTLWGGDQLLSEQKSFLW